MGYWYNDNLGINNITVSTRVRIARNIDGLPFSSRMSEADIEKLRQTVKDSLFPSAVAEKYGLNYIEMDDVPEAQRQAMKERHTISREFAAGGNGRAIVLSDDERISIMIGEEDHIRLQVILPGGDFDVAYRIANEIDDQILSNVKVAYSKRLGFLTECPTNVGTGLRVSAMMHLPLIEGCGKIPYLQEWVNKTGFTIRGTYGEGSKVDSSLYQISNQITLGITGDDILASLKAIVERLTSQEQELRLHLDRQKLEDDCFRSLYLLKGARIISSKEMMALLSKTMIGINCGIIPPETLDPVAILVNCQPYMLMAKYGANDAQERDTLRSSYIRENIRLNND